MTKKTRNWLLAVFIVAFPFALFFGFLIFMEEPPPPLAPLPNPNGYEDLVKAGKLVKGNVSDYDKANTDALRGIVSSNGQALARARVALSDQCGVPLRFTQDYITNHVQDLIAFRSLAQALVCEGKLAEKEKQWGAAAKSDLDTIRLGNEVARGGILIDEMLGVAIRSLGENQLQDIVINLDAPACRNAATTLETIANNRQTWAATMQQEAAWVRRVYGWRAEWLKLINYSARQKNLKRAMDAFNNSEQREGRLMIALAARAYELDKGHPPASASDLAPDYLKAVPQDPVTGTNLVYWP